MPAGVALLAMMFAIGLLCLVRRSRRSEETILVGLDLATLFERTGMPAIAVETPAQV